MRKVAKTVTASVFMLSLLGSAAVLAQGQGEQTDASQSGMHGMGMKNDMTEMMGMMKEMKQMMTQCNKMMESMMNNEKSGNPSGESETQSEKAG